MSSKQNTTKILNRFRNKKLEFYHRHFDGKKSHVPYPPLWVTVGVTGNCAFKCEFCVSHCPDAEKDEKAAHQFKMPFDMKLDDFKKIVNLCYGGGVPRIHVCGTGEPFLHPHILEIVDYVISVYSQVSLQTDFIKSIFEKNHYIDEIIKRRNHISFITTDIFPQMVHEEIKRGSDFDYLLYCMETISRATNIPFGAHVLLTKKTYRGLTEMLLTLSDRKINFYLDIVHLLPFGFNEFTSLDNVYVSSDIEIKAELDRLKKAAKMRNIRVSIPRPWDRMNENGLGCPMFWRKLQLMPSKKLPKDRWLGNAIPQQCNAVVSGEIYSIGNLLDYDNFSDFWNNEILLGIRKKVMSGELPDKACRSCYIGAQGKFRKLSASDKAKNCIPGILFL